MIFDHQIFGFIFGFDIGELIEMNLQNFKQLSQLSQDQNVFFKSTIYYTECEGRPW